MHFMNAFIQCTTIYYYFNTPKFEVTALHSATYGITQDDAFRIRKLQPHAHAASLYITES